jgi:hypothetical protein
MESARKLRSDDPALIKASIISLFDSITDKEILALDKAYQLAPDKTAFLTEFETFLPAKKALKNPILLEKWTHYRWIRLELTNLAYMHATLNHIEHGETHSRNKMIDATFFFKSNRKPLSPEVIKKEYENDKRGILDRGVPFKQFQENIVDPLIENPLAFVASVKDSIENAIQDDYLSGVPIQKSISVVSKIMLQVVGTEHPTDPLSQHARDALSQIAKAMDGNTIGESHLLDLLQQLQSADSIPPARRQVVDEIHRNIQMTLDKLYDGLPQFVQSILDAYQHFYGEKLYIENEDKIFAALEGDSALIGHHSLQIESDASWAGFDADGNQNITPKTMKEAIGLHRIRAAEKHAEILTTRIIKLCDEIRENLKISDNTLEAAKLLALLALFSHSNPNQLGDIQKFTSILQGDFEEK